MGQNTEARPQLTMKVEQHPNAKTGHHEEGWLEAEVKIAGAFAVDQDLNPGEEFTVSIANADGEVIAHGCCELVNGPSFPAIKLDGKVVGHCRSHKLEVM